MPSAKISFLRMDGIVEMKLSIAGIAIAQSASQESIARELQIHEVNEMTIEGLFSTELPTSPGTLKRASTIGFSEPMAALKLIAACSSMGEVAPFSYPERRARPRIDMSMKEG